MCKLPVKWFKYKQKKKKPPDNLSIHFLIFTQFLLVYDFRFGDLTKGHYHQICFYS